MKKIFWATINILIISALVTMLFVLKLIVKDNNVISVIQSSNYIDSLDYKEKTSININNLFDYIRLQTIFETDGKYDDNKVVAESVLENDHNMNEKKYYWTLGYINSRATYYGIYIDNNYDILQYDNEKLHKDIKALSNIKYVYTNKKYFDASLEANEFVMTEEDFIKEVYTYLSDYTWLKNYYNNTNFKYLVGFYNDKGEHIVYSNTTLSIDEMISSDNSFIYANTKDNIIQSNMDIDTSTIFNQLLAKNNIIDNATSYFCIMIDNKFPIKDNYYEAYKALDTDKSMSAMIVVIILLLLVAFAIGQIMFITNIIKSKKNINDTEGHMFVPFELIVGVAIIVSVVLISGIKHLILSNAYIEETFSGLFIYVYIAILYVAMVSVILFISIEIENGYFEDERYKRTLIGSMSSNIHILMQKFSTKVVIVTMALPIVFLIILDMYVLYYYMKTNIDIILFIGITLIIATVLLAMYLWFINNAYVEAVTEQTKQSNMRSSLITNVSHDIRTPLTSIINYSDLLKMSMEQTDIDKEKVYHFANVLSDKSIRLKVLLDELILLSKASSKNLDLNLININLKEFIGQVVAEFDDKFNELSLKTVLNMRAKSYVIVADSNELYRVFQNLFSNICKYAMPKTNVYIDLKKDKKEIVIEIKNITKDRINFYGQDILERFVKGDTSRNSEGFGLGLSIAKDLVSAMNGKFTVNIDGDLFKVEMRFLYAKEK